MTQMAIKGAVRVEYPPTGCIWQVVAPLDWLVADSRRAARDHGRRPANGIVPAFCKKTNLCMALAIERTRFS
jgi:hypothetical protein